jgi:hypothetical protein
MADQERNKGELPAATAGEWRRNRDDFLKLKRRAERMRMKIDQYVCGGDPTQEWLRLERRFYEVAIRWTTLVARRADRIAGNLERSGGRPNARSFGLASGKVVLLTKRLTALGRKRDELWSQLTSRGGARASEVDSNEVTSGSGA